jgi:tetratricopeptide (TPR) repeat protein
MTRTFRGALAALLLLPALAFGQASGPAAQPAGQQAAPTPQAAMTDLPDVPDAPLERQMSLMEARILSREGDLPKSLALYERLRREYPDDQEVYEDFLETLAANDQYERALYELVRFRKKFGATSRSERIEAGIYAELKRPQYGLDILERAQRGNPNDIGLWADVGVQRQASKDANGAIQAFSHVLDMDPENQAAKSALHELLLEKRPRLEVGFSLYDQGKNITTATYSTAYSAQVGDSTRLFTQYDQVHVSRPNDERNIKADLGVLGARVEHELNTALTLEAGLQSYVGLGDGLSPMAGARYDFGEMGRARANYAYHLPWYDQVEAAGQDGNQDRLRLEYELPFRQVWTAYGAYERESYRLGGKDYGSRWEATGSLSRRMWENPDVYLTYTLQRAEFEYDDPAFQPFEMIRREFSQMGTLTVTKPLTTWLEATVSGGIKHDYERHVESLMLSPRLVYHPIERLRVTLGWDYASEASTLAGGESNNFYARIAWTW